MNANLAEKLANSKNRVYIIAPAGFGKTHLIASSVQLCSGRQLILTHTYAGVNSLRNKMSSMGVSPQKYHIETIAGFSLGVISSFPVLSGYSGQVLPSGAEWNNVYTSCSRALISNQIGAILKANYDGVFIDEYQDCSKLQHDLVLKISNFLPCRILGDPLQGIFNFNDDSVVWDSDIYPFFTCAGELEIPWRWNTPENIELGNWLKEVRAHLENPEVPLPKTLPKSVKFIHSDKEKISESQISILYKALKTDDSVIGIFSGDGRGKNSSHELSRKLKGNYSSIEEVEGKDLKKFSSEYDRSTTAKQKAITIVGFLSRFFTNSSPLLTEANKRGDIAKISSRTKNKEIAEHFNRYILSQSPNDLFSLIDAIQKSQKVHIYRRDLYYRFLAMIRICIADSDISMLGAYTKYHVKFRNSGRPLKLNKIIGTTLLVKGLEYDHAIILNPDALDKKNFYVAITRGKKTLTLVYPKK